MAKEKSEKNIEFLLNNNKLWAESICKEHPGLFENLSHQQKPEYLWIGCSDSRVPANQVVNVLPGELFVHRNIANQVLASDMNCMSVLLYAVEHLKVRHVLICGHYGCGGVAAAASDQSFGALDGWLHKIKGINDHYREELESIKDNGERLDRLCELNVIEQVSTVSRMPVVQKAWTNGQELTIHGVIYNIRNGMLKDLEVSMSGKLQTADSFHMNA